MCVTIARLPAQIHRRFFSSPDRGGEHPEQHLAGYAGLMQADAYAGFSRPVRGALAQSVATPSASSTPDAASKRTGE
jgi:Transposase IS66 family